MIQCNPTSIDVSSNSCNESNLSIKENIAMKPHHVGTEFLILTLPSKKNTAKDLLCSGKLSLRASLSYPGFTIRLLTVKTEN